MKTARGAAVRLTLLLLVVIGIVTLVVQAIERPVGGETRTYQAEFGDVFGLRENADVRLRGVQVGKITEVALTPDHTARVSFTLLAEYPLRSTDEVAIRFQNLTGQRYLAITRGADGPELAPGEPVRNTVDSFDITSVFNGLRPLLNEADPEVYNRFLTNVVAMIEGTGGGDMAPLLRDVAALANYAEDRTAVITTIVANLDDLSQRLRGRSANLENILRVFHSIFMPVASRMEEFLTLMDKGSIEMTEVVRTADALALLLLGARDSADALTDRMRIAIPDTTEAVRSLWLLPGLLESLNALIPSEEPDRQCAHGAFPMPVDATVLLQGRALTVCEGGQR